MGKQEQGQEQSGNIFDQKPQPQKTAPAPQPEPKKETLPPAAQPAPAVVEQPTEAQAAATAVEKLMDASGMVAIQLKPDELARRTSEELLDVELDVDVESRLLEIIERRQNNKKKLIKIAIKQTNESDWIFQGEHLYLLGTGAEKIAPIFGVKIVNWRYLEEKGEDEQGKWIRLWYFGDGQIAPEGRVLYEMPEMFGSCWTRDDFFGKANGKYKSLSEIDMSDLRKKTRNDLTRNVLVRLVGLRSVTPAELTEAGLDVTKVKGIARGVEANDEDKKAQEELTQTIKKIVGTEPAAIRAKVKALTYFKDGDKEMFKEEIKFLTGKWLASTLKKAKEEYAKAHPEAAAGGAAK